jgi:hypothetical protein
MGESSTSSSPNGNHVIQDMVTSENIKEKNASESSAVKIIEEKGERLPQNEALELVEDTRKSFVEQADEELKQIKYAEPSCSKIPPKHMCFSDVTGSESSDRGSSKDSSQRTSCIEPCADVIANNISIMEPHFDDSSTAMLSTPMLNIIDYLPPEIMHNLQGSNLPNKLYYNKENGGSTNSNSIDNVLTTSDMDATMDCLYYPPSCEVSLQNHVLTDCENGTFSDVSNFPFELQHNDSNSCGIPMTDGAEKLKDIVGLISSQNSTSPSLLHNLAFSNIRDSENVISTCSSEDSEHFVNSVFEDVGLSTDGKEENYNSGSTLNMQSSVFKTVASNVLAPEVVLESHAQQATEENYSSGSTLNIQSGLLKIASHVLAPEVILEPAAHQAKQAVDADSRCDVIESSSKKSKKSGVHQHKKGERYLPHFKMKVLAYAASHTLRETAKKFKVNDGTVSSWKKEKDWKKQLAQVRELCHHVQ